MVFAHGFGCDQNMWRLVSPAFENDFRTVLFDHVGAGHSDLGAYDFAKYGELSGYADDLIEICQELGLSKAVFVGHSVSAMIGVLAANKAPGLFEKLVLVGPSPRYINDVDYVGGFEPGQVEELLQFLSEQSSRMVGDHVAGDHGQFRPARIGRGTGRQFLHHRSEDRRLFRQSDVHQRQPR
jgi:sigma-B regulation protein RsbQ